MQTLGRSSLAILGGASAFWRRDVLLGFHQHDDEYGDAHENTENGDEEQEAHGMDAGKGYLAGLAGEAAGVGGEVTDCRRMVPMSASLAPLPSELLTMTCG